jgi:uncharacterized protein YgiM (DUF1202 family)
MFGADLHKKEGYPLTDMNVREKATTKSKIIDKIQYKQKIEILDVVYDKEGQYWYHTKYGYMFGPSITTDVRFVKADLLHIRLKPTLQGKELSYFLDGDKVIVIKQAGKSDGYNWVLTTEGYVSSDYLTTALIKNIEHDKIPTKTIEFYEKPDKTLKPSQTIKKEEVEFIVKEAIKIDSSKSKEEIKKEQALAIKNNKIKSQIKKENIHSKSKSNLYALSKEMIEEILSYTSLEDGDIIMSGTPKGVGNYKKGDKFTGKIYCENKLLVESNWEALEFIA